MCKPKLAPQVREIGKQSFQKMWIPMVVEGLQQLGSGKGSGLQSYKALINIPNRNDYESFWDFCVIWEKTGGGKCELGPLSSKEGGPAQPLGTGERRGCDNPSSGFALFSLSQYVPPP